MSYDNNNIFAKILKGEIPCNKIYEDKFSFDSIIEELTSKLCPIDNAWSKLFIKTTINSIFNKCEDLTYKIFEKGVTD